MKLLLVGLFFLSATANALSPDALPESPAIPSDNAMSEAKINLGKQLYFDPRLSSTNKISCNSCHAVSGSGTDNKSVSTGIDGKKGGRNAPTVWNSAFWSVQFWDGRAKSLEEQAKGPIINPVEMGMKDHAAVVEKLKSIPGYVSQFKDVFKSDINIDNVAKAIAAYERTLITPGSSYDRYKNGDKKAMSALALRGMDTFQKTGCTSCHFGALFNGPPMPAGQGFFMKFPTYPGTEYEKKYELAKDLGKYEVTKNDSDKNMWRVPSLRNVALTAPYFHTGNVTTLDEAVRIMAKVQLNKNLKPSEVNEIVAFLKSLTGNRPKQTEPKLPM